IAAVAEAPDQRATDRTVHLRDIGRGGDVAGADRPDRLVGDDQLALLPVVGQRAREHLGDNPDMAPGAALGVGLADADDGGEAAGERRLGLGAHFGVGLVLIGAALAVAG